MSPVCLRLSLNLRVVFDVTENYHWLYAKNKSNAPCFAMRVCQTFDSGNAGFAQPSNCVFARSFARQCNMAIVSGDESIGGRLICHGGTKFDFSALRLKRQSIGEGEEMHRDAVFAVKRGILIGRDVAIGVKVQAVGDFKRLALVGVTESDGQNVLIGIGNGGRSE